METLKYPDSSDMVLEPQVMIPNGALQLYAAAAAAQFGGPRSSRVPTWAPFLQFGMPGMGMFLNRPRFGPETGSAVGNLSGCAPALPGHHPMSAGVGHMTRNSSSNNSNLGAQSDDDDDDKGERGIVRGNLR